MKKKLDLIIKITFISIIIFGISTAIYMLLVNRSLWADEAYFSYSFSQRGLFDLLNGKFELDQIAPVTYIYIVKIITMIFGNTEVTLRLFSLFSYVGVIFLVYYISKNMLKMKYPLAPSAFVSSMSLLLRYSNEFKVYIFDCFCVLLVLVLYNVFMKKKIKRWVLTILYILLVISSNPTIFFIGGVYLYDFIKSIKEKNKKEIKEIIITGIMICSAFIIYYLVWLKGVATSDFMIDFWKQKNITLLMKSKSDIIHNGKLILELFAPFKSIKYIVMVLVLIEIINKCFIEKNNYIVAIMFGFIFTIIACSINMFPIQDRLWLFSYPIVAIMIFDCLELMIYNNKTKFLFVGLSLILIISTTGIIKYLNKTNVYMLGEEGNLLVDFVDRNIKSDENLFVYYYSMPLVKYKIGYDNNSIGKYENNILYSSGYYDTFDNDSDIEQLVMKDKCYLMFTHFYYDRAGRVIEAAQKNGYLELIYNPYNTPLYYYVKNKKNMKTNFEYNIDNAEVIDGRYYVNLTIKNTGSSIINHDYENIYLRSRDDYDIIYSLGKKIEIGNTDKVKVEVKLDKYDSINLQLYNSNGFWYDEIGIKPIKITKELFEKE